MTASEILDKLKESEIPVECFAFDDGDYYGEHCIYRDGEEITLSEEEVSERFNRVKEELGGWEEIAQKGGEGQGDEWYSVKYFPVHGVYIKTDGIYTSYHGTDFDDEDFGCEVHPKEKVITVYE